MATKVVDARAQSAVDYLQKHRKEWAGNILPRCLPAALPARSAKRGWRDGVSLLVLNDIIGAHRVYDEGEVFFKGALYQVDRQKMANDFCTDVDEISESINWLAQIGVVGLVHRTRLDPYDGHPTGSLVFAYPIMSKLDHYRQQYLSTGKTPKPVPYIPQKATNNGA